MRRKWMFDSCYWGHCGEEEDVKDLRNGAETGTTRDSSGILDSPTGRTLCGVIKTVLHILFKNSLYTNLLISKLLLLEYSLWLLYIKLT